MVPDHPQDLHRVPQQDHPDQQVPLHLRRILAAGAVVVAEAAVADAA